MIGIITAPEVIIIITTSASAVVTIINSIASGWGRSELNKKADDANIKQDVVSNKLDVIHQLTNSNLTSVQDQLRIALDRIERLEAKLDAKDITK